MIGRVIGNYKITNELARGGMGTVYRGQHLHLPREVVVKSILLGAFAPAVQSHLKARFRREAYIQSQFDHPNIVRVYEFFAMEDNYFMVMEFVPGVSLRQLLEKQKILTPVQSIYLARQALSALDYAHNFSYQDESEGRHRGVIHRDIKPANLLLGHKGHLKITDFGIVKAIGDEGLTQSGFQPGTVEYMSPEQLLGIEVDERSDIYCVGVNLYEMLTGRLPFPRSDTGSDWHVRKGHIELSPPSMRLIRPEIHPELDEIVIHSLQKEPDERFQTAAEFLDAITRHERKLLGTARPTDARGSIIRREARAPASIARSKTEPVPETNPGSRSLTGDLRELSEDFFEEAITIPLTRGSACDDQNPGPLGRDTDPVLSTPSMPGRKVLVSVPDIVPPRRQWHYIVGIAASLVIAAAAGSYLFMGGGGTKIEQSSVATRIDQVSGSLTSSPAASIEPGLKTPETVVRVEDSILLQEARVLERQEQYEAAIRKYEEYQQKNPRSADAQIISAKISNIKQFKGLMTAAGIAMEMRKFNGARENYTEALKLMPESNAARTGLIKAEKQLSSRYGGAPE